MRKLATITALYVAEGLPFGFFGVLVPVWLRRHGYSLDRIGLANVAVAPWLLKPLWAPLVDKFYWPSIGRRRSWILPLQFLLGTVCLLGALIDFEANPLALVALVAVVNTLSAAQDVPIDGLAVDVLDERERGLGNAAQVAGYKAGMLIAQGAIFPLAAHYGTRAGLFALSACLWAAMLAPLSVREPPPPVETGPAPSGKRSHVHVWRLLRPFLASGAGLATLAYIMLSKVGESVAAAIVKPHLVDLGYDDRRIGMVLGAGLFSSLLGSVIGGALSGPLGRRRALLWFSLLEVIAISALAVETAAGASGIDFDAAVVVEHFTTGLFTPVLFAYMMDITDPRIGATHYALLASAEVSTKGLANVLYGFLAVRTGTPLFLALAAIGTALPIGLLPLLAVPSPEPAASARAPSVKHLPD